MKIAINNRQKRLTINKKAAGCLISFLMQKASRLLPERKWDEISVVIADNALMSAVNTEFMNDSSPTDVLSFALPPMPGEPDLFSGEVFVNAEIALEIGGGNAAKTAHELALYIAHGCDHIMDQDDRTASERKTMRSRELRWLKEAATLGFLRGFASPSGKARKRK